MNEPAFDAPAAAWSVFSDELQHRGDPRGLLISLSQQGAVAAIDAHVRAHAEALLGPAAPFLDAGLSLGWRDGFIGSARVEAQTAEALRSMIDGLLEAPLARHLHSLEVAVLADDTPVQVEAVLARLAASTVESLALVDVRAARAQRLVSRDFEPGPNLVAWGSLAPLWAMPSLRALRLEVADLRQVELGAVRALALESLILRGLRFAGPQYGDEAPCGVAQALATAELPGLRELELRLCETWTANTVDDTGAYVSLDLEPHDDFDDGDNEGAAWDVELGDALAHLARLPLRRLALTSFDSHHALLDTLQRRGLPPTLETFEVSDSTFGDAEVAWVTARRSLFPSLRRFVAHRTRLSEIGADHLRALGWLVERSAGPDAPTYRYVVGME